MKHARSHICRPDQRSSPYLRLYIRTDIIDGGQAIQLTKLCGIGTEHAQAKYLKVYVWPTVEDTGCSKDV